jgi:hypothetical protein
LALHHAGFAVPPMLPSGRWALTPPFHPYQSRLLSAARLRELLSGRPKVFLRMATEKQCTGGLFSVALSVADSPPRLRAQHEKAAPWRYQARRPLVPAQGSETFVPNALREDHGVRTFLPASLLAKKGPAITRLARQREYIIFESIADRVS